MSERGGDDPTRGRRPRAGRADREWRALRFQRNCGACVPVTGTGAGRRALWVIMSVGFLEGAGEPAQTQGATHGLGGVGRDVGWTPADWSPALVGEFYHRVASG